MSFGQYSTVTDSDPVEQEKDVKVTSLLANLVICFRPHTPIGTENGSRATSEDPPSDAVGLSAVTTGALAEAAVRAGISKVLRTQRGTVGRSRSAFQ
ncbi:hypothetical protein GCM10010306_074120 [Streptomyces umbrinus]|uniref:hypothetical protein n=1 Tax=Streptomyces umbrinus TaxID=67370 RepID=UPI001672D1F2|nr:hypothetical protein [Streptomyces umbrinus]GHB69565.1 hypothetical protein GCM10010306_074120 [Streptomyces umbrinus]